MTIQTLHSPARSRRSTAAWSIGLFLWLRLRRSLALSLASWLFCIVVDRLVIGGQVPTFLDAMMPPHILTLIIIPQYVIFTPMMMICQIDEPLWTLPVRTKTLVGWMIFYGSLYIVLAWIGIAAFLWRPAGMDVPIWWPAALIASIHITTFAIRLIPMRSSAVQAIVSGMAPVFLAVGGGLASFFGISAPILCGIYIGTMPFAYLLAVYGAQKTRCGDTIGLNLLPNIQTRFALRRAFRSASAAQVWFEWRNHGFYLMAVVAAIGIFSMPILFVHTLETVPLIAFLSQGKHEIHANRWAIVPQILPFCMLYFALVIGSASPNMREKDKTLSPFLATRPLDCAGLVAAKLRTATLSTLAALAVLLPFFLIWLALPAWEHGQRTSIGATLWSILLPRIDTHGLLTGVTILLLLAYFTWRFQTDMLFLQLTGRPWVFWICGTILLAPLTIPFFYTHVLAKAEWHSLVVSGACSIAVVKLVLSTIILRAMRRRGVVSAQGLHRSLALWAATALLFSILLCSVLSPYHIVWWYPILAVILLMPGVRLALAPLALAWDRTR